MPKIGGRRRTCRHRCSRRTNEALASPSIDATNCPSRGCSPSVVSSIAHMRDSGLSTRESKSVDGPKNFVSLMCLWRRPDVS